MSGFDLNASFEKVNERDFGTSEERYLYIADELDSIIKENVTNQNFNPLQGRLSINVPQTSVTSTITTEELNRYIDERGWQINVNRQIRLDLTVPTYIYRFAVTDGETPLDSASCVFKATGLEEEEWQTIGTTDEDGILIADLSQVCLPTNKHPYNLTEYVLSITYLVEATPTVVDVPFDKINSNYGLNFVPIDISE